ncbi:MULTISPECIES: GIY-YIG nuclease family protein [unclassified Coleofasciculus]|uniref:GIY-YIG nuclease family protein n=1 Tax=unclassified Coleofasciculus TaxID=2692782 RepID=UPI001882D962|nr:MULTISPECIES: GIY-YIG nuclease family protein [unclassified Coleofasciculus]MBE9127108.1 GIY-YIG nuclease family protein [Coleofasciculus sp. LEGE 07081]MBE9150431.1 GIY-YIG nuclease family protein [Coleofasciculus sp. LEGE 07092]
MVSETQIPTLSDLDYIPYLDETGNLPEQLQGKIGVYAIFDSDKTLQLVNYSRDIYLSLKQHLVRQPQSCYWLKAETIARPNRTHLETIRKAWIDENGTTPAGNDADETVWNNPIDAKETMTDTERLTYQKSDGLAQIKLLKQVARRVESQILELLQARGVQTEIRFNPKLKEQGLLDLK